MLPQVLIALAGCTADQAPTLFSADEMRTLRALVDVILPETDSPAASAANTHVFVDLAAKACATEPQQQTLRAGLRDLEAESRRLHNASYADITPEQQADVLRARVDADLERDYDASFFKIVKDYTLTGYFLSEIGATQALAYEAVPGGYWGDLPLAPGQKAWAI